MAFARTCPRCEKNKIPSNEHPGEYPGAMSRITVDGRRIIEICSMCGEDEAFEEFFQCDLTPVGSWPIKGWLPTTIEIHTATQDLMKESNELPQL
jgi:hypothetical protein